MNPQDIVLADGQSRSGVDFGEAAKGTGYIPEPSSFVLMGTAVALLGIVRRRWSGLKRD